MSVRILVGDCRDVLRQIDAESVHCAVTSPPYYGLRDYGIAPSVWGGDQACSHKWAEMETASSDSAPSESSTLSGNGHVGGGPKLHRDRASTVSGSCVRCGAWRGAFGLEPDWKMYVDHSVEIFREVWRVLRCDGTLWLNLGDSYATGAGAVGARPGGGARGDAWAGRPEPGSTSRAGHRGGTSSKRPAMGKHEYLVDRISVPNTVDPKSRAGIGPMTQPNRMPQPGLKPKDLMGIPWRVAFALQEDGWWLRQDVIWHKPNPMPESTTDRCTKAHEYLFLLTKSERYFYDADAIKETASQNTHDRGAVQTKDKSHRKLAAVGSGTKNNGSFDAAMAVMPDFRNKRSVWTVSTKAFAAAHFATFPPDLIEPCILAGTSARGVCRSCAAPWDRVTVKVDTGRMQMPDGMATYDGSHENIHRDGREVGEPDQPVTASVTIGWWPSCRCEGLPELPKYPQPPNVKKRAERVAWRAACTVVDDQRRRMIAEFAEKIMTAPAQVLDPFGGAGTTGLVADRAQRAAVLIELNPVYAEMAAKRLRDEGGMFCDVAVETETKEAAE